MVIHNQENILDNVCLHVIGRVMQEDHILLKVKNLSLSFQTETGRVRAVDQVSFSLKKGETLGLVGESGCGKTVTALALMRLLPHPAGHIDSGEVFFHNKDLLKLPLADMFRIRGRHISMIFQEPMTALNPVKTVGKQIAEVYDLHFPQMTNKDIKKIA